MPRIDTISPVRYDALWPYHHRYDNLPLEQILARLDLVNLGVEQNEEILNNAIGSAGSLSNRLNQSIQDDGNLISSAVDDALHNIGAHTDGEYDGTEYVRMELAERDKLELISDEATALQIQFETASTTVEFTDETIIFQDSSTISWTVTAPNIVKANMSFPDSAAHQHYYDLVPVHDNISTPDYINYKTTSVPTAFIEDTLRVYVNGIRVSENNDVYVYNTTSGPAGSWTLLSVTPDPVNGTFELSRAISINDSIIIDFDTSFI